MSHTICVLWQKLFVSSAKTGKNFHVIVHFILITSNIFLKVPVVQHPSAMPKTGHMSILKTSQLVLFLIFKRHIILLSNNMEFKKTNQQLLRKKSVIH